MKLSILKGATSVIVHIFVQDSSVTTTVAGLTGLTSGSAGLVCTRGRLDDGNAAGTAISLSGGTRGTWSSGGLVEKDSSGMAGWYEFGIPNAALASGSRSVAIHFKGATNMVPVLIEIELTGWDNQDATAGGISRIDAAISSRSTYAGGDTSGTTTLLSRIGSSITISGGKIAATLASTDVTGNVAADLQTIKTQTVSCAGGVTVPAATLASTTNITAGTLTTVTNLTNLPAVPTDWLVATGVKADAVTKIQVGLSRPATAQTIDQTTAVFDPPVTGSVGDAFGKVLSNLDAAVSGAVTAANNAITAANNAKTSADTAVTNTGTLITNLAVLVAKFTGITFIAKWLAIGMGKTPDAPTLAEVNATTAGASYDNTTDSLQAIKDVGVPASALPSPAPSGYGGSSISVEQPETIEVEQP